MTPPALPPDASARVPPEGPPGAAAAPMGPGPARPSMRRPHQRGAALLLAMLILALVATLASAMVWQQWRAIQVETADRARAQSAWILIGALDWARLILREDRAGVDHLGEPWAVPLAEARLSSFLAAGPDGAAAEDDGPEAFLSGSIVDVQARYNLNNLVVGGQVVPAELEVLKRLFDNIGVAPDLATTIAVGLRDGGGGAAPEAGAPPSAASAASATTVSLPIRSANPLLLPQTPLQLRWLGIDGDALGRLLPYVTLLPTATRVNLNTAPKEVLAAVVVGLDLAGAQRLVQARERNPFGNLVEASNVLGSAYQLDAKQVGVASDYFEVRGRLRLGDRVLEERSLVWRNQRNVVTLTRERINNPETSR